MTLRRPELRLVGLMAYESQIAGVGDAPRARPVGGALIRSMQTASGRELRARRAAAVARVRELAGSLEFVNAGGTGIVIGLGVFALLVGAMAGCGGDSSKYV